MSIARRIKSTRSNANFGSFGSIEPVASKKDGVIIPTLKIIGAGYSYDRKKYTPLWDGKKWLQKGFHARQSEDCTFSIMTEGIGKAVIFATFRDSTGKLQYLFARRVKEGECNIKVKIPFRTLNEFRFGVAKKVDSRVGTDHLTDKELVGLTSNMLLINETEDAYITTDSLGFAGFGAVSRFTDSYQGIKSSDPSYAKAASGNKLKTGSGTFHLWNGKLEDHRWAKHGYTGKKEKEAKRARAGEASSEGPVYVCDETGYYAHRTSTYLMRYDPKGNQLGYDAMENRYSAAGHLRKPITALPAGVPVAMVGQFFVHDPEGTAGWIAGGPQYSDLGNKRKKYGVSIPHSHWVESKVKKATEVVVDVAKDTYEAGAKFVDDPSLTNLVAIVTAPIGMNSCWHYADKVTIPSKDIFFVPKGMLLDGATKPSGPDDGLVTTYAGASAIPYRLRPQVNISEKYNARYYTKDNKRVETKINKRDYAVSVEWFNPSTKKWSAPSKHPSFSPKTDKEGKFMVIFRFPRQLDPAADRQEIQDGISNGMADYSWHKTKYAYPYPKADPKTGKYKKAYNLLGRMEMKDSDTEMRKTFSQQLGNETFTGKMFLDYELMIKPPKHTRGSWDSDKKPDFMYSDSFSVRIADPAKFTYLANPEVDYATYIDGELKPGSVVLVMGKGLGSVTGNNCILTMKGWPNGPPSPEDIAKLGTKTPAGHTPIWVYENLLKPNKHDPRKVVDGSAAGTLEVDYLEFMGHITADDLLDDKFVSGEQVLIDTWKRCFNLDLNADWFRQKAATGDKLEGTDPNNPLHYIVKGDKGEEYSFPFSIAWFKVPQYWVGPYLDYNEQGRLQEIEGRPYAISKEDQMMYIIQATPTGHVLQTKLDIVTETTEQKELLEAGYPLGPAMNELNFDPSDITETIAVDEREREFLKRTGQTHPHDKPPKKYRYTNNQIKATFFNWDNDRVMKADSTPSIDGFSNGSDFYVEDVTEKWGASSMGSGPQTYSASEDFGIVPIGQLSGYEDTMMVPLEGLGSPLDDLKNFGSDVKEGIGDTMNNPLVKAGVVVGAAAGSATGAGVVGITKTIADADLSTGETITVVGIATAAAISLGLGAAYLLPLSLAKVPGTFVKSFK